MLSAVPRLAVDNNMVFSYWFFSIPLQLIIKFIISDGVEEFKSGLTDTLHLRSKM